MLTGECEPASLAQLLNKLVLSQRSRTNTAQRTTRQQHETQNHDKVKTPGVARYAEGAYEQRTKARLRRHHL